LADDILSRSAAETVALYRSKRVSPVEVVTATLDRIDRLYNAFVMVDREGAVRDARARNSGGGVETDLSMDYPQLSRTSLR
jgi:Asp-tRNA(Asn)/Glu-tRNA(Gln) amidotransferase A subunit family amidase